MGKRSSFERRERDFYPTPPEAVEPLLPYLAPYSSFAEPCCGDGALLRALNGAGHLGVWLSDIAPSDLENAIEMNALGLSKEHVKDADYIITNPPWSRDILHPIIVHFTSLRPTWLLFDADWMHTKQAAEFLPWCERIVSVGRVKWIPDSPHTGKDNAAWYLFNRQSTSTMFVGRAA